MRCDRKSGGHSLSPMMHNYYGEALNLDYIYVPCNVDDDKVGEAIRGAYALGFGDQCDCARQTAGDGASAGDR